MPVARKQAALSMSSVTGMTLSENACSTRGLAPPRHKQCQHTSLQRQFNLLSKGSVGPLEMKHVIPMYPDSFLGEKPKDVPASSAPGETKEIQVRKQPASRRAFERFCEHYSNNLILALQGFRHFPAFNISMKDLDNHYEWFWDHVVPDVPDSQMDLFCVAHTKMWELVDRSMNQGKTLSEALTFVRTETLWINRFVRERIHRHTSQDTAGRGRGASRGKGGRGGSRSRSSRGRGSKGSAVFSAPKGLSKGKPQKGGGKAPKGKGAKTSPSSPPWPSEWARKDQRGVPFCRDFLLHGNCQNGQQCPRSHHCPYTTSTGYICNGKHSPHQCPLWGQ